MKNITRIMLGVVLIACGVIYIPGAFGVADVSMSLDGWWTLFIIVPSIGGIVSGKDKIGNAFCLLLGVYLLLAARGIIEYEVGLKLFVPIVIILLGLKLIVKSVSSNDAKDEERKCMSLFTTQTVDYTDEEVKVAKVGAVFGGAKYNLSNAKIQPNGHIDLLCAFGGAEIIVPQNVNIKVNAFCLFGGISDKRAVKPIDGDGVTLVINGFCLFGGADIK